MIRFLRHTASACLSAVLPLLLIAPAAAAPTQWGGNGHYYEAVIASGGISWDDAKTQAESMFHSGQQGHLATITSDAENNFVFSLIDNDAYWLSQSGFFRGPWIGGSKKAAATSPLDPLTDWEWVTGEAFTYENWRASSAEPSGDGGGIHFGDDPAFARSATWNDLPSGNSLNAYVVEYVPEPSSLVLAALACLGGSLFLWSCRREPRLVATSSQAASEASR